MNKGIYWLFFIVGTLAIVFGLSREEAYLLVLGCLLWVVCNSFKIWDLEYEIRNIKKGSRKK